jgi:hypothetical protein
VENLLKELEEARFRASAGQMDEAQEHIEEALKFLGDAMAGSETAGSLREAQIYVAEARFAAIQTDSRHVIEALSRALRALGNPSEGRRHFSKTLARVHGSDDRFVWLDTSGVFIQSSGPITEEQARADLKAFGLPELDIEIRIAHARESLACALDEKPPAESE